MKWPSKRIELWGESPGSRIIVTVRWPRTMWVKDPCSCCGVPQDCATLSEQIREYKMIERYQKEGWHQ